MYFGTLSCYGEKQGLEVTILSGDRDTFQLATDKVTIRIPHTKAGKTETDEYNNRNIAANILPGIEECRQQFLQAGLTRREAEVALLVIKHMSNAEIANELYISETTVKKHVSNIFFKTRYK